MLRSESGSSLCGNTLHANLERLWGTLVTSSAIGAIAGGGLSRLALSDADKAMRDKFVAWCTKAGYTVRFDQVGNIFARRAGTDPSLPCVLVGSHLDTQIVGGRYDGILGVLAGLEVLRSLCDRDIATRRGIELVCWTNEEGVRFQPPMMGSGVFSGTLDPAHIRSLEDSDGSIFAGELERIGYDGPDSVTPGEFDSYFELHIEQGPLLHAEGIDVGIVSGGYTSYGMEVTFHGENAHSGPTPMRQRKDAMVAAAALISAINALGWDYEPEGRTTCASLHVSPNKYGIIADHASLILDMRHPDAASANAMRTEARRLIAQAASSSNVDVEVTREWTFGSVTFNRDLMALVETCAEEIGASTTPMLSAAGHDAYNVASVLPSALIFTPCKDGITHNRNEHIEPQWTQPGVDALLNAVYRRAQSVDSLVAHPTPVETPNPLSKHNDADGS